MNKTKYKILFIFTLSGIAVMTACGNTTESSAAPTPANSSVVLGESTEQSEASVDNDSITELDFSNKWLWRVCRVWRPICKGEKLGYNR